MLFGHRQLTQPVYHFPINAEMIWLLNFLSVSYYFKRVLGLLFNKLSPLQLAMLSLTLDYFHLLPVLSFVAFNNSFILQVYWTGLLPFSVTGQVEVWRTSFNVEGEETQRSWVFWSAEGIQPRPVCKRKYISLWSHLEEYEKMKWPWNTSGVT